MPRVTLLARAARAMPFAAALATAAACSSGTGSGAGAMSDDVGGPGYDAGVTSGDDGAPPSSGDDAASGDTFLPWEGGPSVYATWANGPSSDPATFPIFVWLQSPSNASAYKDVGVNMYVGLYAPLDDPQLAALKGAGMPAMLAQSAYTKAHAGEKTIAGYTQPDEPDNAQPQEGGGYGPCVPPADIVSAYGAMHAADPTRPVFLNFGQAVANELWPGRGSACSGHDEDYAQYAEGADVVAFDFYPRNATEPPSVHGDLWRVAHGMDRLRGWVGYKKPVWTWIETTAIDDPDNQPSAHDIRAEIWLALVHGSRGIGYFAHRFQPSFDEKALLDVEVAHDAVKAANSEIISVAAALNSPSLANAVTVSSSDAGVPVDLVAKRVGGKLYVFAVAAKPSTAPVTATIAVSRPPAGATKATVLGEGRAIPLGTGAAFSDTFAGYDVHLYVVE